MSITTDIRSLPRQSISLSMGELVPDTIQTISVTPMPKCALGNENAYLLGCRFVQLLLRQNDHGRLSHREKEMLPWMTALRVELRRLGVTGIRSEVSLPSTEHIAGGRCDLLVEGGHATNGVIEVKVSHTTPSAVPPECLAQLGGYSHLLAEQSGKPVWAAAAWVNFRTNTVRVFTFKDASRLGEKARDLLNAA